ncbi:MAG: SixA phosphatase family protein [Ferruginibacter sp.]
MKTLLLLRHAHSDWGGFQIDDHSRPLSKTGKDEALDTGLFIKKQSWQIDGLIHSDARRTTETALIIHTAIQRPATVLVAEPSLYQSSPETIETVVMSLPDSWSVAGIVCHNPGISDFMQLILPVNHVQSFSPACVAAIAIDTEHWLKFTNAPKRLLFFYHPLVH